MSSSDLFELADEPSLAPALVTGETKRRRTPYVLEQLRRGAWRESTVPAAVTGLDRDLPVFLADRKTSPVVHDWHGDQLTHCPPVYWDLAIGSGSCGLACRGCFLLGTFRERRDPWQPLLYDNVAFLWEAARRWLIDEERRAFHTLGVGTDRSDSLLFEGMFGHVQHLSRLFADRRSNPADCKLLLLTKSRNTHYLEGLPTGNTIVSFSLNPQQIADLWEGCWPGTDAPIPPSIQQRLAASLHAQTLGFEVRWRLDPILTPDGWETHYCSFLSTAAAAGHRPSRITLGSFRETTPQLEQWRRYWGIPAMAWRPHALRRDGTHWRCDAHVRIETYRTVGRLCSEYFPQAVVSLCKETHAVRKETGLCSALCNCLGS